MDNKKTTLNDIRLRKAEVLCQIRQVRAEINEETYALCHPFKRTGRTSSSSAFKSIISVASNVIRAYKVASSVASLFRRKRR